MREECVASTEKVGAREARKERERRKQTQRDKQREQKMKRDRESYQRNSAERKRVREAGVGSQNREGTGEKMRHTAAGDKAE